VKLKLEAINIAVEMGADEVDVVWNLTAFKSGDHGLVLHEMKSLVAHCKEKEVLLKVILETGALDEVELEQAAEIATEAAPDFVKTSTGIYHLGAELDKVKKLRQWLPENIDIKASGGIRTRQQALDYINAGVMRIGTSGGVQMVGDSS